MYTFILINHCLFKGLDPADTVWAWIDPSTRLDITDGEFVDIMHTNGGNYTEGEIAFDQPMGHVDFYVNGGEKQPSCPEPDNGKHIFLDVS